MLSSIAYDEHHPNLPLPKQAPESSEVITFSCGHAVEARRLAEAGRDDPNVERRTAEDTVEAVEAEGGPS